MKTISKFCRLVSCFAFLFPLILSSPLFGQSDDVQIEYHFVNVQPSNPTDSTISQTEKITFSAKLTGGKVISIGKVSIMAQVALGAPSFVGYADLQTLPSGEIQISFNLSNFEYPPQIKADEQGKKSYLKGTKVYAKVENLGYIDSISLKVNKLEVKERALYNSFIVD